MNLQSIHLQSNLRNLKICSLLNKNYMKQLYMLHCSLRSCFICLYLCGHLNHCNILSAERKGKTVVDKTAKALFILLFIKYILFMRMHITPIRHFLPHLNCGQLGTQTYLITKLPFLTVQLWKWDTDYISRIAPSLHLTHTHWKWLHLIWDNLCQSTARSDVLWWRATDM